ncbi:FAD-dependent oxidoreductase [Sinorhizobium sp. 8-89]|uniref:flavin monoamine oxidase family protein n=1 Tax=Sinorhizobium sp. 7-81 TaxID=3049087 RepID=UPI0024C2D687|nr:FAD-dependent oxidoreductase [Sinorhizobium sp. 7-81]MDK1386547.1 FAD-dependent oxidoreductase [Sinorhizobium sp. 7-81]
MKTAVAIVGGGLAGLHAARLLQAANIHFVLFEARERLGGRILSVGPDGLASDDGFDLGPSWYWPEMQPPLAALVDELGVGSFPQPNEGMAVYERTRGAPPQRYPGISHEPRSMRFAGGTNALIKALASGLPSERIRTSHRIVAASLENDEVTLKVISEDGFNEARFDHVIFALPPRLLQSVVTFQPEMDQAMSARWRSAATWMAPHAKFFAIYDKAFWREAGLSGTAQSMVGPLAEVHDASTATGAAALFGFVGIAADDRGRIGEEVLKKACVEQLGRLFGGEALRPRAVLLKDWSTDPATATADDRLGGAHPHPDRKPWVSGDWIGRVSLAGSETSPVNPGYLAGAVEAAEIAVEHIIRNLTKRKETIAC